VCLFYRLFAIANTKAAHEDCAPAAAWLLFAKRDRPLVMTLTQLRIRANGSSPALARELAQQKEQIEDLLQLVEDWLNLLGLCRQKPDLTELSPPLKVMLRSLGIHSSDQLTASQK
jgi:hypothetical protein